MSSAASHTPTAGPPPGARFRSLCWAPSTGSSGSCAARPRGPSRDRRCGRRRQHRDAPPVRRATGPPARRDTVRRRHQRAAPRRRGRRRLRLSAGATLYAPPLIAGFVGADHVAMLLATRAAETSATVLALDIGTNTEVSLARHGRLWSCSTASGPAFEGAHISDGMRASPGAIERVHYRDGRFLVQTVGGRQRSASAARGSSMRSPRVFGSGSSTPAAPSRAPIRWSSATAPRRLRARPRRADRPSAATSCSRGPTSARSSSHRGAIHAGTELLLEAAGIDAAELDEVVVAGAFGTYLDLRSAICVGLLPDLPEERFRQVGNAAGAGARQLAVQPQAPPDRDRARPSGALCRAHDAPGVRGPLRRRDAVRGAERVDRSTVKRERNDLAGHS